MKTSSPRRSRVVVLIASFGGVLLLLLPFALLAQKLRGSLGGLLLLIPLSAWGLVASVTSGTFADRHKGLVWSCSLLIYLALYCLVALPTHFALRGRGRLHDLAIGLVALVFLVLATFAFPVTGLPI